MFRHYYHISHSIYLYLFSVIPIIYNGIYLLSYQSLKEKRLLLTLRYYFNTNEYFD